MNTSEKRLSKLTLFAYGMGDFASNLCWTFIGSYLSVFYTDVVGMAPAIASAIMLIAKIWDGVNDPMFGAIAERTNTKRGRFRPYILFGAPILAVLSVLAFTTIGRGNAAVIYAAITYIGCGMAYTVVNLSYGSLSTVMTTNPEDIAQLNSWRMMGTNLSSVLLNAITAPLLMKFSGGSESYTAGAYTKVAILFAICALPLFYFVYVNCKETIKPAAGATKVSVGTSIKTVLSNKPLILVFFIQLLAMTAFFGRMGVVIYYLMYNVQRYDLIAAFMSLPSLFTVIGIFLTKNYIVKIGKKKMAAIGYIGAAISLILILSLENCRIYKYSTVAGTALCLWFLLLFLPDSDGDGSGCHQLSGRPDRRAFRWNFLCNGFTFHEVWLCLWRIGCASDHGSNWLYCQCTADRSSTQWNQCDSQPNLWYHVSVLSDSVGNVSAE